MNPMAANPATVMMRAFERDTEPRAPRRVRRPRKGQVWARTARRRPTDLT